MARHPTADAGTLPYWSDSASVPNFPRIDRNLDVDVVVVGGGITGLTTAYLLVRAGKSVVLLERTRCGQIDTGHTSAHLTMATDVRLSELATRFGRSHAQAVWDAGLAAITQIEAIVRDHEIECEFEWVDGYLHAPTGQTGSADARTFEEEAHLASDLGFDVTFASEVPFARTPGVRIEHQARFHPRKYLAGLTKAIRDDGGRIFEHSEADEFYEDPLRIKANGRWVSLDDVVIATHNPLVGIASTTAAAIFQTKLALYTSYVIAGQVPVGKVPDALFWDTAQPYHYLRIEPGRDHDLVIFGGEDHKTGQADDTSACYERLERTLRDSLPEFVPTHRWSGQVIETPDGLPYIGRMTDHQYAATGFSGNGLTFGTVAAMVMADSILGRRNPWVELFDPGRTALRHGLWDYIKENADYPYYLLRDRLAGPEGKSLRSVRRREGKVIEYRGSKVAAYRDANGALTLRSAVCTHMGCLVGWNQAEQTWDCPCHGSRFTAKGKVVSGPAEAPLAEV